MPQLEPPYMERISPEPFYLYCPQNRLEPVLRAAATARGCDVRYSTQLVSFVQDDRGRTIPPIQSRSVCSGPPAEDDGSNERGVMDVPESLLNVGGHRAGDLLK